MQRQKQPSRSTRKEEQETGAVAERERKTKAKAKPKPRQGPLDPERVRKGLMGRYRPAMKTARPKPISDESADDAEDVQSEHESQESTGSVEEQLDGSDSNDSFVVVRKAADPYSPPDSDDEPLMPMLPSDESSDDDIQVKMPARQPPGSEGYRPDLMSFCEKQAILRKELNIPKRKKNKIKKRTMLRNPNLKSCSANGNAEEEPLQAEVLDAPQMQDEMEEQALEETNKDLVDKTVTEPAKADEHPGEGSKAEEPKKEMEELEPKEGLDKSGNEDKAMENVDKQEKDESTVEKKDPNEEAVITTGDPEKEEPEQGPNKDKEPKKDEPKLVEDNAESEKSDQSKARVRKLEKTVNDNSGTDPPIAKRTKESE